MVRETENSLIVPMHSPEFWIALVVASLLAGRLIRRMAGHFIANESLMPLEKKGTGCIPPSLSPTVEIAAVIASLWASTVCDGTVLVASIVFGWLLLSLAVIDWHTLLLARGLTALLVITGLAASLVLPGMDILTHLIGGLLGFIAFWGLAKGYRYLRGHEGLGGGDAKLLAGLGMWVSWQGLPTTVLYAAMAALLFVVGLRLIRGHASSRNTVLPFGPFLALGGWLVWLYGPLELSAG